MYTFAFAENFLLADNRAFAIDRSARVAIKKKIEIIIDPDRAYSLIHLMRSFRMSL